jgi:hypothetical protein
MHRRPYIRAASSLERRPKSENRSFLDATVAGVAGHYGKGGNA